MFACYKLTWITTRGGFVAGIVKVLSRPQEVKRRGMSKMRSVYGRWNPRTTERYRKLWLCCANWWIKNNLKLIRAGTLRSLAYLEFEVRTSDQAPQSLTCRISHRLIYWLWFCAIQLHTLWMAFYEVWIIWLFGGFNGGRGIKGSLHTWCIPPMLFYPEIMKPR